MTILVEKSFRVKSLRSRGSWPVTEATLFQPERHATLTHQIADSVLGALHRIAWLRASALTWSRAETTSVDVKGDPAKSLSSECPKLRNELNSEHTHKAQQAPCA